MENGQGGGEGGSLFDEFVTYCRYVVDESGLNRFMQGLQSAINAAGRAVSGIADRLRSSAVGQAAVSMGRGISDGIRSGLGMASGSVASFFSSTRRQFQGFAREVSAFQAFGARSGGYNRLDPYGMDLNNDRMNKLLSDRRLGTASFTPVNIDRSAISRANPGLDPNTYSKSLQRIREVSSSASRTGASIVNNAVRSISGMGSRLAGIGPALAQAGRESRGLASGTRSAANSAERMNGIFGRMQPVIAHIAAIWAGMSFTKLYDTAQSMTDSLTNLVGSAGLARDIQKQILDISKQTNSEYEENTEIFSSLHRIQDKTKLNLQDELKLTKAIGQAAAVGGGSIDGRKRAIAQLSKAFGMDQMNAVALHSIERQAPGITMAIAKGLGKSIGDLKKLSGAGKLTGSTVAQALLGQADAINAMSQKVRPSFATIGLQAKNIALGILQDFDHAWRGISDGIQYVIDGMFWLERQGRNAFRALSNRMGGAEQAAKLVAIAVVSIGGPMVLAAVARLTSAMWSLAFGTNAAIWPFTLVAAAIAGLLLVGEDMYVWANGGVSMMEDWVGPYDDWKDSINDVKTAVSNCWGEIKAFFAADTGGEIDKLTGKNKPWAESFKSVLDMIKTTAEKLRDLAMALKELKEGHTDAAKTIASNLLKDGLGINPDESYSEGFARLMYYGKGSKKDFNGFLQNGGSQGGLLLRSLVSFEGDDFDSYKKRYTPQQLEEGAANSPGATSASRLMESIGAIGQQMQLLNGNGATAPGTHLPGLGGPSVGDVNINVHVDATNADADSVNKMGGQVTNGIRDGLADKFPFLSLPNVERSPYNS